MAAREQRTPTRAPTTDAARTQYIERGPKAGAGQGPTTLPRTKFDASTDPREKSAMEALRRRFMFTDEEVEAVSPSKPVRAASGGAGTSSAAAPSEAERARLLSILDQQRDNLAALQEKKRRLESAQAEFSKIDSMLSDVLSRSSQLHPSDMAQAAQYLSALTAEIPSVPGSAASSVAGDDRAFASRTNSQADTASESGRQYEDDSAANDSEDLTAGIEDPELIAKLHDLQQKNNELRRLQDQLQALRGMQAAMVSAGGRPALIPSRPAPPPPPAAAAVAARFSASAAQLPARAGGPMPAVQRTAPPPPPRAARDPASIQADLRQQLQALQAITARAASLGRPGAHASQGEDNDEPDSQADQDQQSVASSAGSSTARALMARELNAKREQLRMLEAKLAELHELRSRADSEHSKNLDRLAMLQKAFPQEYAAAMAKPGAAARAALLGSDGKDSDDDASEDHNQQTEDDERTEEGESNHSADDDDDDDDDGSAAAVSRAVDPQTAGLLQRLRQMEDQLRMADQGLGLGLSGYGQLQSEPPLRRVAAVTAASAKPAADASGSAARASAAPASGTAAAAAAANANPSRPAATLSDERSSLGRLQGLLSALQDQQKKLRELQARSRAYVVDDTENEQELVSERGNNGNDDAEDEQSPTGDQERQMYLPGRISPRSGSVSVVSANGASTAPTLGTLDVSTRIGRLEEQDEAWSRPQARDEAPPVLSGSFVLREISSLRQRMDHITDQLENLTARLPAPAQNSRTGESGLWEEEAGVTDELLRGKLELQSMRLATEYSAMLAPAVRAAFMKEFAHFFSNPATSSRAFRLALRVLPDALELSQSTDSTAAAAAAAPAPAAAGPAVTGLGAAASYSARGMYAPAESEAQSAGPSDAGEPPLFSLVKDEIYRDVALFITANEDRPQFLQDLFNLLQDCSSDYLRQRCLNALQDVFSSVLREDSVASSSVSAGQINVRGASLSGLSGDGSRPTTAVRLSTVQPVSALRATNSSSTPRGGQASATTPLSAPGSGIRTRPEVADRVGYDYGVSAADSASLATPADDVSVASSAVTEDPVFGKDPLAETAVFQGSGGIQAAASGAFDQVLARLDESLRRSALEDRTQYPEDLLASAGEGSDVDTQTISTIDTSMDRGGDDVDEVQLLTNIHKFFATLPADGVVDASIVDRVVRIVESSLAGALPAAIAEAMRAILSSCVGQPVHLVGAVVGQKMVDLLYTLQGVPNESDAELDNRRDDDLAAAYDVPESDTQASPALAHPATAAAVADSPAASTTPLAATPMPAGEGAADAPKAEAAVENHGSDAAADVKAAEDNGVAAPAGAGAGQADLQADSPTTDATPTQASTPDAV